MKEKICVVFDRVASPKNLESHSNICHRRWIAAVSVCCSVHANFVWWLPYRFRQMISIALLVYAVRWRCSFWSAFRDRLSVVWPLHRHFHWPWPHWTMAFASPLAALPWSANWNIDLDTNRNMANRYSWCRAVWKCGVSCKCKWSHSKKPTERWISGDNRWTRCSCRRWQQFLWKKPIEIGVRE